MHLRGSRGAALGDDWSQTPAWWPQQSRLKCAERGASPGCASIGWKIISTKSAPGRRPEPAHGARWCCGKTVLNFSPSSRMVHQHAPTTRDPLPDGPQKLLALLQLAADTRVPGVPHKHGDARRARELQQARDQTGMGNDSGESRTANAPHTFSNSDISSRKNKSKRPFRRSN